MKNILRLIGLLIPLAATVFIFDYVFSNLQDINEYFNSIQYYTMDSKEMQHTVIGDTINAVLTNNVILLTTEIIVIGIFLYVLKIAGNVSESKVNTEKLLEKIEELQETITELKQNNTK